MRVLTRTTRFDVLSVLVTPRDRERASRLSVVAALLALATACRSVSEPTKPRVSVDAVAIITLTSEACDISLGGTLRISARATDQYGLAVPLPALEWRSSAPAIASVDQAGVVHGVAPGTSVISATAGTLAATKEVAVDVASGPLRIVGPDVVLSASTAQLGVMAQRGQCGLRVLASEWTSSDTGIASVDATGLVTARRAGTFTVSATRLGVTAIRTATVAATVGRIAFLDAGYLTAIPVGGAPRRIITEGSLVNTTSAAISPDGRSVAFDCPTGVCLIASDGSGTSTTMINRGTSASWSANSLIVAARLDYAELGILDVELGRVEPLRTVRYARRPRLSPDGTEIAYECDYTNPYDELSDVCIQSTVSRTLVAVIAGARSVAWSPDGTRLAYVRDGLCVAPRSDPNSCTTVIVRSGDEDALEAAWSPDGSMLVVARSDGLWIASPERQSASRILAAEKLDGRFTSPSWGLDP